MRRLNIELSQQEHSTIKALAAMNGQSMKDYVKSRVLPTDRVNDDQDWQQFSAEMQDRIAQAQRGEISKKSVADITQESINRAAK